MVREFMNGYNGILRCSLKGRYVSAPGGRANRETGRKKRSIKEERMCREFTLGPNLGEICK